MYLFTGSFTRTAHLAHLEPGSTNSLLRAKTTMMYSSTNIRRTTVSHETYGVAFSGRMDVCVSRTDVFGGRMTPFDRGGFGGWERPPLTTRLAGMGGGGVHQGSNSEHSSPSFVVWDCMTEKRCWSTIGQGAHAHRLSDGRFWPGSSYDGSSVRRCGFGPGGYDGSPKMGGRPHCSTKLKV